jgi:signal transduction histidine kinase
MAPIIEQIIRLFSAPEGNLIYTLVLGFCVFGAWLSCLYAKNTQKSVEGTRMQFGLLILLLVQLLLFGATWLAWQGIIDGHLYLPPLNRTLALFSLVLIIWLWAFPKPDKVADALITVVGMVVILLGVINMVLWLRESSDTFFNISTLGGYAYYSGLGLTVIGVILLLLRRISYWGYGLLMLLILLVGYTAQYFITPADSDYSWFVHLGEMVAFIILFALPKRLVDLRQLAVFADIYKLTGLVTPRVDAKLVQTLTSLITEPSPQQYYQELTRFVANLMNADFCLLMMPPKTGEQLIIPVGYSRLQDRMIDGFTADGHKMPSLLESIKNGKTLLLTGDKLGPDLRMLADELDMRQAAQLLMVPFHPQGTSAVMGIAVLSKPSDPLWNEVDAQQLMDIIETLISSGGKYSEGTSQQADQGEMMEKLERTQAYSDQVRLEYAELKAKYDSLSAQVAGTASQAESMAALMESQKNLQDSMTRLEIRNRELESLLAKGRPSMEEVEQLRQELRSALTDLARIPSTLSKSDQKMLEMQLSAVKRLDEMQPTELVTSIAQEFRQPLSSIVGYTDLLLGESVGLLGAMQRKFLERVKASTERLGILLNELVQIMSIDGGIVDQTPVSVDLKPAIDEAVGNMIAQISEKNIALRVEVPENLPPIRANKDALQQILANLLQNACLVTPADGEIRLFARVEQQDNELKFMHISVTDQGGGIEKADLARVFSRRYKMENPIIKGIGDSGVGLSIVKSLVELHKGRVWVDTKVGEGSTFSILLPMAVDQTNQRNPISSTS